MTKKVSKSRLSKYIWGLVGVWLLFLISFFIAYWRVGKSDRYNNQPFNSLDWNEKQKDNLSY